MAKCVGRKQEAVYFIIDLFLTTRARRVRLATHATRIMHARVSSLFITSSFRNTSDFLLILLNVIFRIDNSEYMRNGDYPPNRFDAQTDAVTTVFSTKVDSNPENTAGVMTMAGKRSEPIHPSLQTCRETE